jgi:uncharacterized protein (DUF433 family)
MDRISIEPGKCGGRPCIRGYRLRVKDVLELLANGASWEEILEDYAFLEREDIQACLDFAAAQSDHALIKMPWSFSSLLESFKNAFDTIERELNAAENLIELYWAAWEAAFWQRQ